MVDGTESDRKKLASHEGARIIPTVDKSVESIELVPGTDGFHLEPRCRICRNDQGADEGNDLLASGVSYAMVLRVEQYRQRERVDRNGGNPAVPPRLFGHGLFTGGVLLALVYLAAFTSMSFTIALLWQAGLGSVPSNLAL